MEYIYFILVLAEPSFLIVNPVARHIPIVLNFFGKNPQFKFLSINFDSEITNKNDEFIIDAGTEIYLTCSAVYKGQTLLFGGATEFNQVSSRTI